MQITISFRHLDHTEALDSKIKLKSQRLRRFLGKQTVLKWTCYIKEGVHHADVKLVGPHFVFQARGKADAMYKTIDVVLNKLEKQLEKKFTKWNDHIHHKHEVNPVIVDPESMWIEHANQDFDDLGLNLEADLEYFERVIEKRAA